MKLVSVRVQNYKCVHDSGEFMIDPKVTCLVGKNESGKTALLQSLAKLNPLSDYPGHFDSLDFPRAQMLDLKGQEHVEALTSTWELDPDDLAAVREAVGPVLLGNTLTVAKDYSNTLTFDFQADEPAGFGHLLDSAQLHEEEKRRLLDKGSIEAAYSLLESRRTPQEGTTPEPLSPREEHFIELAESLGADEGIYDAVVGVLNARLPKFVYFSEYLRMPGQVSLQDLDTRLQAKTEPGNRVFLALLGMIGRSPEELRGISEFEELQGELEGASNKLTREIFQFWTQNKQLRVQFRFEHAHPGDTPPFNAGYVMRTRIENMRHGASTPFDQRSSGFIWFFSFLVWFSQVRKNYGENLVLLLDEPGLALHAKAQADLLRYIEERLAPKYQVVYTTHSPFMIDPAHLLRARTVEDVYDEQTGDESGTKVGSDVLSTDADTLFPLRACLGYDITQTLFVGQFVLLVEGPAELLYLPWFNRRLKDAQRVGLDRRWTLAPCGGVDKIPSFLSLFGGQGLHIATLIDYAEGQKGKARVLKGQLLAANRIFTCDTYAGQPEADVEDVIGRPMYVALINHCYGLGGNSALPTTKPQAASVRVVKEVEHHFCTAATIGVAEFDHFRPAEFLMSGGMAGAIPGLDEALDRFEKLFAAINATLPPA